MFKEAEHLETLWKQVTDSKTGEQYYRSDKSTNLIVPSVDFDKSKFEGSLNNDRWAFHVGYAFRDALGISFDQRSKNKQKYMVWTQSPYIDFKEGDSLKSKCGTYSLQVKMATPMRRERGSDLIDYGLVEFQILKRAGSAFGYHSSRTLTQYEFLKALIYGLPKDML